MRIIIFIAIFISTSFSAFFAAGNFSDECKLSPNKRFSARIKQNVLAITDKTSHQLLSEVLEAPKEHFPSAYQIEHSKQYFWTIDSRYLFFCSNANLYRFDVETKILSSIKIPQERVYFCSYAQKNNLVAVACRPVGERYDNWTVYLVGSNNFKLMPQSKKVAGLNGLVWSSSENKLAIETHADYWTHLHIVDKSLKEISNIWAVDLFKINWSPDDKYIAGIYKNRHLKIFSLDSSLPIQEISSTKKQINSFLWSQNGKILLAETGDSESRISSYTIKWNDETNSPAVTLIPSSPLTNDDNFFPKTPEEVFKNLDKSFDDSEKYEMVLCLFTHQMQSIVDSHKFDKRIKDAACMNTEWGKDYGPIGSYYDSRLHTRSKSQIITEIINSYANYLTKH